MGKFDNCIECFQPLRGDDICPICGFHNASYQLKPNCLPPFSMLRNRYMLGRVVGRGGFGVTYVGLDVQTNCRCAVKEYMPSEYATRDESSLRVLPNDTTKAQKIFAHGKSKYLMEAESLQKFRKNPIVVDVWGYFEENNTAYIVMEFLDGMDLQKMANANGAKLEPAFVMNAFKIIASALMEMHAVGILHRDLKPENIFYTKDGQFKLFDFGSARDYVRAEKMGEGLSVLLTPGYAPPEQYSKNGNQGPWTDVYALCATFYRLASGKKPKDGLSISKGVAQPTLAEMDCGVSKAVSDIIRKGMEPDIKKRYRSFKELLDDLEKENPKQKVKLPMKPTPSGGQGGTPSGGQDGTSSGGQIPAAEVPDSTPAKSNSGSLWEKYFGIKNKQSAVQAKQAPSVENKIELALKKQNDPNAPGKSHAPYGYPKAPIGYGKPIPAAGTKPGAAAYSKPRPAAGSKSGPTVDSKSGAAAGPKPGPASGPKSGSAEYPKPGVAAYPKPGAFGQPVRGAAPAVPAAMQKRAKVRVISGEKKGLTEELHQGVELCIGRNDEECGVVIQNDSNVSRVHCKLSYDEKSKTFFLMDVSSNGTFLADGKRLTRNHYYPVKPGSRFYLVTPQHMLQVDIS